MTAKTQNKWRVPIAEAILALLFLITVFNFGRYLLGDDLIPFLKWWGILFLMGIGFLPLTSILFAKFRDKGYLFSKTIGIVISGWFMWLCSSLHILKFNTVSCFVCLGICIVLNYGLGYLYGRKKQKESTEGVALYDFMRPAGGMRRDIILELVFLLVFLLLVYLRSNIVEGATTEKFMNYAFLTNMLRTDYMPPIDTWVSGMNLNYYYFGQYLVTYLIQLSVHTATYGYVLGLMTVASFCLMLVYSLVYQMAYSMWNKAGQIAGKVRKWSLGVANIAGIVAGVAVTFAGNFHYVIFAKIVPVLWDILQIPGDKPQYFFPQSTRYIGYIPRIEDDRTITEFPAYSFIAGDLHAHIVNVMLVVTLLGILFAWLLKHEEKKFWNSNIIVLGFLIGIFHMSNYWDFPIYYVVCGAVILTANLIACQFKKRAIGLTAVHGVLILGISELVSLPFNLKFHKMVGGIALAEKHSEFYQLMVLWGLPALLVIGFLIVLIREEMKRRRSVNEQTDEEKSRLPWLQQLQESDLMVAILGLCAMGLVLVPEVIYVKDIFYAGFPRCNTMFKLTYQAFILFGICMGYIIVRFLACHKSRAQVTGGIIGAIVLFMTLGYWGTATRQWFGDYQNVENYKGLDASTFIDTLLPDDAEAIDWINENITEQVVVLEANGDSYTPYERVSVLTGMQTVMGWHTHEWLWMDDLEMVDGRGADVTTIYTSTDVNEVQQLIDTYGISYIFVGTLEHEKYETVNMELLRSLGEVVYEKTDTVTGLPTFIVKL